jgi:chitinase
MQQRKFSKPRSIFIAIAALSLLLIAVSAQQIPAWAPNTSYTAGAQVIYQGSTYQCRQAHTSIVSWEPPNTPALWSFISGGGGGGDTQSPTAPANLRITATTSSSVSLAWNPSSDNVAVTGYDVLRGGTLVGATAATTFTATGLAPATAFTFTIRARDAAGNLSAISNAISATTQSGGGGTQPSPWAPNTPYTAGTRVTYQGSTYECRQNHTSLVGWEPANVPALWLLVTGDGGGGDDTQAPTVPGNLRVTATTSTSVSLAWNASTDNIGVTGYDVFRNAALAGATAATSFTVSGLSANTTYSFTVKAKDAAGNVSPASNTVTATTTNDSPPPPPPAGRRIVGYFAQWGIYGRQYFVKNVDTSGSAARLTHINYAFANIVNSRPLVGVTQQGVGDAWADYVRSTPAGESVDGVGDMWNTPLRGNWGQLKKLKAKHPHLKVMISLGGWSWSGGFSDAALTMLAVQARSRASSMA